MSDISLLVPSRLVLEQGVMEGRKVFGKMFSVVDVSIFVLFLPMLPIQVPLNNLLYDFSQTAIPMDAVDTEWLAKPRK